MSSHYKQCTAHRPSAPQRSMQCPRGAARRRQVFAAGCASPRAAPRQRSDNIGTPRRLSLIFYTKPINSVGPIPTPVSISVHSHLLALPIRRLAHADISSVVGPLRRSNTQSQLTKNLQPTTKG
jgi:hypothetical protein